MGSRARKRTCVMTAGAVVVGGDGGSPDVLLVRSADSDEWRLPVAAVHPGEYLPACAARAAHHHAGLKIVVGAPLGQIPDSDDGPLVAWWRARATPTHTPTPEVGLDKVAWVSALDAIAHLPSVGQQHAVRQALALPDTLSLVIVRHGKAMQRSNWSGRDQARPLDARGRRQATALAPLFGAYGISRLVSSTSTRCVKTLLPYAKAEQLDIEGWAILSEEQAETNLKAVDKLMKRLVMQTVDAGRPLAISGHRPVLPTMLGALGIPNRPLKPGACLVAHLTLEGHTLAIEHHPPRV